MSSEMVLAAEFWKNRGITLSQEESRELIETAKDVFGLLDAWDRQGKPTKKENNHERTRKKK